MKEKYKRGLVLDPATGELKPVSRGQYIQQWLYDLLVYEVYNNLGKIGILLFTILLSLIFIFLAIRVMRYYGVDLRLASVGVLAVCAFYDAIFTIRPGLFTLILQYFQL